VTSAGGHGDLRNFKRKLHSSNDIINTKSMAQKLRRYTDVHQIPTFNLGAQKRLEKAECCQQMRERREDS
jgi:hypothetical protein